MYATILSRIVAECLRRQKLSTEQLHYNNQALQVGGRVGLLGRALAFHQCGPGSISALGVICGLSLLVLYSAIRGFSPVTSVFPSHQKSAFDLI